MALGLFRTQGSQDSEVMGLARKALADFEGWYAETRGSSFWTLFEQQKPDTPRVDFRGEAIAFPGEVRTTVTVPTRIWMRTPQLLTQSGRTASTGTSRRANKAASPLRYDETEFT